MDFGFLELNKSMLYFIHESNSYYFGSFLLQLVATDLVRNDIISYIEILVRCYIDLSVHTVHVQIPLKVLAV